MENLTISFFSFILKYLEYIFDIFVVCVFLEKIVNGAQNGAKIQLQHSINDILSMVITINVAPILFKKLASIKLIKNGENAILYNNILMLFLSYFLIFAVIALTLMFAIKLFKKYILKKIVDEEFKKKNGDLIKFIDRLIGGALGVVAALSIIFMIGFMFKIFNYSYDGKFEASYFYPITQEGIKYIMPEVDEKYVDVYKIFDETKNTFNDFIEDFSQEIE